VKLQQEQVTFPCSLQITRMTAFYTANRSTHSAIINYKPAILMRYFTGQINAQYTSATNAYNILNLQYKTSNY